MIKKIENNLYKISYAYGATYFIEASTKQELFEYIAVEELKGFVVQTVNLINISGTTPRIAFRTDKEYKTILNKLREKNKNV